MTISRRYLFALLGGAAAAPLLPKAPVAEFITRYTHRAYGLGFAITKESMTFDQYAGVAARALKIQGDAFRDTMEREMAQRLFAE